MRETDLDPHIILERKFFETKGSGQILDCGCGNGEILERFSSNNQISIIGLDISKENLDHAKKIWHGR